ncbi:hypothetical protein ASC80_09840 [Afipia sp. Root123D2]|nr:hypothetical protein ASC80_09840 [Afipia sp. Root123D2]
MGIKSASRHPGLASRMAADGDFAEINARKFAIGGHFCRQEQTSYLMFLENGAGRRLKAYRRRLIGPAW